MIKRGLFFINFNPTFMDATFVWDCVLVMTVWNTFTDKRSWITPIFIWFIHRKKQILCHGARNQIKIDLINYPKISKHSTDGFSLTSAWDHPARQQQPSDRISNSRISINKLLFADGAIDVDYLHELSAQPEWNLQRLSTVKDQ